MVLTILALLLPRLPLAHVFEPGLPPRAEADPGEREMKAIAAAWQDRIAEVALRGEDWMVKLDDTWFAWSHGRLLPEAQASRWQDFAAIPFYSYPLSLPPLPLIEGQAAKELRARVRESLRNPPRRSETFFGTLLDARDRGATEARLVKIEVAGFTLTVHERLRAPLTRISNELSSLRRADPVVAAFLRGLAEMNGYNYRFVDGTRSRSLHSYGLALDLIPKSYGGGHTYWLWAINRSPDWWTIPYAKRWMPPLPVIDAFEKEGFVWGGKWLFFDTMHFEYRPELILMARSQNDAPAVAEIPES